MKIETIALEAAVSGALKQFLNSSKAYNRLSQDTPVELR
jgi:hypothetical protein